jgi:hypothetical protein
MMSFLPLYQDNHAPNSIKGSDANVGLWFERFFDQFNHDASEVLKPDPKKPEQGNNVWLQKFKTAGNTNALQDAATRQMDLVKQLGGKHKFFNTVMV